MTKVQIVLPHGFFGASDDEPSIVTAMRIIGVGFGGDNKYGVDVENDVFLMKPYCWCEKAGECPWCTGCAAYSCAACERSSQHEPNCFQNELRKRFAKYDEESGYNAADRATRAPGMMAIEVTNEGGARTTITRRTPEGEAAHQRWRVAFDKQRNEHSRLTQELYLERRLTPSPYQWHCDCGAIEAGKAMQAEGIGCDYHHGRGIFDRFKPWTLSGEAGYYDPPNFWFKPTNFRLTWYKYIGREMKSNDGDIPPDLLEQVFATHPQKMAVERAIEEWIEQEQGNAEAFGVIMRSFGMR